MNLPSATASRWEVGNFTFISQNPDHVNRPHAADNIRFNIEPFIAVWSDIERVTGHRWRCTSFLRKSPSHDDGNAFDLAPDFSPSAQLLYSASQGSDPVLYKRPQLIRALQLLKLNDYFSDFPGSTTGHRVGMVIAIEPDHLHVGRVVLGPTNTTPTVILKWRVVKPVYRDSAARSRLPMFPS